MSVPNLMKLRACWPLLVKFSKFFEISSSKDECTIPRPSGAASVALSANHFPQLMTAITASVVDAKLQQFCEEICQGQEEAATKVVKRAHYKKPYTFQKCGNKEQVTFNAKVEGALLQAESDLSSIPIAPTTSSAIQRVSETLCKLRLVSTWAQRSTLTH